MYELSGCGFESRCCHLNTIMYLKLYVLYGRRNHGHLEKILLRYFMFDNPSDTVNSMIK